MKTETFNLCGFVSSPGPIGFCIPIFRSSELDNKKLYFQDISKNDIDVITGFSVVEKNYDFDEIRIVKKSKIMDMGIGQLPVFAFQVPAKEVNKYIYLFDVRSNLKQVLYFLIRKKIIKNYSLTEEIIYLYKDDKEFKNKALSKAAFDKSIDSLKIAGDSVSVTFLKDDNGSENSPMVLESVNQQSIEMLFAD